MYTDFRTDHPLEQCSNFNMSINDLGIVLNAVSHSVGLEWDLRVCISNKFPGDSPLLLARS